jgi:integrase/recombinase XerD
VTLGLVLPKVLTYDEIDRFMLAIEDIEDLVACRVMLYAGLRVNEACNLQVNDFNKEKGAVFVRQGKNSKDRWSPLDIGTISLAHCYARSIGKFEDSQIFVRTKRTLQRHVEDIYQKAGITWGPTCHTLRHTCATWQLDKGIPLEVVKNNLGHTDIATTQIYLHLAIRQRSRIYTDAARFGI